MANTLADMRLDDLDRRLIEVLQCDGRVSAERAATVLGLDIRVVHRRWASLLGDGTVRVVAAPPRQGAGGVLLLRIQVLPGKLDAVTAALVSRADIPFVDVSASGNEIGAVLLAEPDHRNRLVFRQFPATAAVTSVVAETVLHVYTDATDWRLDALTVDERVQLTQPPPGDPAGAQLDDLDRSLAAELAVDARMSAATLAARTGSPESTVRRRLAALFRQRRLITHVSVDPERLGLTVDANLWIQLPPAQLDAAGRTLARHRAVHGALAVTGQHNLHLAVWLRDLEHLYRFITEDLAEFDISAIDTVLVGQAVKRPGKRPGGGRPGR